MEERTKELLVLGREHYQKGEYDRAEPLLGQVLERTDQFADVHNMLGFILHSKGDLAGAERHFERAIELNPRYTEALLNLAVTYNDLGKFEAARSLNSRLKKVEGPTGKLDPFVRGKIANMHADVAQAYLDAGALDEAIVEMKKAVELGPGFPDLWARLGTIYRDKGALEQAKEAYEAALAAAPRYAHARVLLGVTLLSMGQPDGALASLSEALAIEPENRSAKMYLRMIEAQRAKAAAGAEPVAEPAAAAPAAAEPAAAKPAETPLRVPAPPAPPAATLELDSVELNGLGGGGS